jgi:transposase
MERHGLRDDQFARIENLLPGRPGTVGRNSDRGNRLFVDAVIWKFRVGAPWRDLPEHFGGWCNTHKRFSRWAASGVWENLFKALADLSTACTLLIVGRPCRYTLIGIWRFIRSTNWAGSTGQ